MSCYRFLMIGPILIFAVTTHGQQTTASSNSSAKAVSRGDEPSVPTVETQLKVLTEKLDLTSDQQARIKPILQELHDRTEKIVQDKNLSREERLAKVRPQRYKADEKIRTILSEDQKKKLDLYLQGPHQEMHGNLSGATP